MPDIEIYVETPSETPSVGVWVDVRKASDLSVSSTHRQDRTEGSRHSGRGQLPIGLA